MKRLALRVDFVVREAIRLAVAGKRGLDRGDVVHVGGQRGTRDQRDDHAGAEKEGPVQPAVVEGQVDLAGLALHRVPGQAKHGLGLGVVCAVGAHPPWVRHLRSGRRVTLPAGRRHRDEKEDEKSDDTVDNHRLASSFPLSSSR